MEVLNIILIAAIVIIIVLLVVFFILYYQSNQLVNNVNNQQTEEKDITLSFIPLGTTNDLARTLEMPIKDIAITKKSKIYALVTFTFIVFIKYQSE